MTKEHLEGTGDYGIIDGFKLENPEKIARVIHGDMGRSGTLEGGLGEEESAKNPELVLARYDKIAGYITKDGVKIKTGSFWDFKKKCPREKPEVLYIFNIGGTKVEVDDPSKLAQAISTVQKVQTEAEEKVKEKKAKSKFKK